MSDSQSLVLLSGGIDSALVLAQEVAAGRRPLCLSFHYGQRHDREIMAARQLAIHYDCDCRLVSIPAGVLGGSALTREKGLPTGLPANHPEQSATVVPNRNMAMLSIACAIAAQKGIVRVLFGANKDDAAVYADCRPEFILAVSRAAELSCGVTIFAPLSGMAKRDVVASARELCVPLDLTWSCYAGGERPCGECGACIARMEAGA